MNLLKREYSNTQREREREKRREEERIILRNKDKSARHLKRKPSTCNHSIAITSASMSRGCRKVSSTISL